MKKTKGIKQLEEIAKQDLGIKINFKELLKPFEQCNKKENLEILKLEYPRKIYYFCKDLFCEKCPREYISSNHSYVNILAIYENNKLSILKNQI